MELWDLKVQSYADWQISAPNSENTAPFLWILIDEEKLVTFNSVIHLHHSSFQIWTYGTPLRRSINSAIYFPFLRLQAGHFPLRASFPVITFNKTSDIKRILIEKHLSGQTKRLNAWNFHEPSSVFMRTICAITTTATTAE